MNMSVFKIYTTGMNHPVGEHAQFAAMLILGHEDWLIREDQYRVVLENDSWVVSFWNENRWYSWMKQGVVKNKESGAQFEWDKERPTKNKMAKVFRFLYKQNPFRICALEKRVSHIENELKNTLSRGKKR